MTDAQDVLHHWLTAALPAVPTGPKLASLTTGWETTGYVQQTFIPTPADPDGHTREHHVQLDCWGAKKDRRGAVTPDTTVAVQLGEALWAALRAPQVTLNVRGATVAVMIRPETEPAPLPAGIDNYAQVQLEVRLAWVVQKEAR